MTCWSKLVHKHKTNKKYTLGLVAWGWVVVGREVEERAMVVVVMGREVQVTEEGERDLEGSGSVARGWDSEDLGLVETGCWDSGMVNKLRF